MKHLLKKKNIKNHEMDKQLEEMAADPKIQKELQQIDKEFAQTEKDGLEK